MKVLKFISHPLLLIMVFCAILISGESFGGFYLMYLLMALPFGAGFAIVAMIGIASIVFSLLRFARANQYRIEPIINITGAGLLVLSLIMFFYNDISHYNRQTFSQAVPLASIILFATVTICFVIDNVLGLSFYRKEARLKT